MRARHNAATARLSPVRAFWIGSGLVVLALVLYRPHVPRPFDTVDFSEFLPLMEASESPGERLGAMRDYYAQHGRFNVLQYAGTVARWTAFRDWTPGWQFTRMAVMLAIIATTAILLRRLGATKLGATAGAACFLVAPPAASGWVRLTMAEPSATLLILLLILRGLGFQQRTEWTRDVIIQAAGAAAVLLLKEMLAPLLLLPILASLARQHDGAWRFERPGRKFAILTGAVVGTCAVVAVPILVVFARASGTGYVSLYGERWMQPDAVAALWMAALVPFRFVPERMSVPWLLAMLAWLTIAAIGWGPALRERGRRKYHAFWIALAVFWPLLGIVTYTPWPAFASFYGIPYLLGPVAFIGFGLPHIQHHASHGTGLAAATAAAILVVGATDAQELAARRQANQVASHHLIDYVSTAVHVDTVFVAATPSHRLEMAGPGPTLARHAAATHRPWPPTRDMPCDSGPGPASVPRAVVWFSYPCPISRGPAQIVERFRFVDWRRWRIGTDSVTARIEVTTGG